MTKSRTGSGAQISRWSGFRWFQRHLHGDTSTRNARPGISQGTTQLREERRASGHLHDASGHIYDGTTVQDNARAHLGNVYISGDQHNNYIPRPEAPVTLSDALWFDQMHFRSATIVQPYYKTCNWLFDAVAYKRWRDQSLRPEHNGFLWIKGKPGAGKSTVMKHAWEYAQANYDDEETVSFFFNARGAAMGKSVEGMFRCLLHQVVSDVPQLSSKVAVSDRLAYQSKGWPVEILEGLFRQAVLYLCSKVRMSCYIDALDEGDSEDQVRRMVEFFYDLAERIVSDGLHFNVCLASRYYPKISVSLFEELRLEDHRGHHDDISVYVHSRLRLGNPELKHRLSSEIQRRSSGVFLWVVLVVTMLNKERDRGNQHLLWKALQAIWDGLSELIDDIQARDASDDRFLPAIQSVLYALRPLKPEELYFAILTSLGQLSAETVVWDEVIVDAEMIKDFILSSSKGLLEIGSQAAPFPRAPIDFSSEPSSFLDARSSKLSLYFDDHSDERAAVGNVQFIHEVVREYFMNASNAGAENTDSDDIKASLNETSSDYHMNLCRQQLARETSNKMDPQNTAASQIESSNIASTLATGNSDQLGNTLGRIHGRAPSIALKSYHGDSGVPKPSISDYASAAISHSHFSQICQTYIRASYARERLLLSISSDTMSPAGSLTNIRQCFPFLKYSLDMVLRHAELSSAGRQPVNALAQTFPWDEWIFYKSAEDPALADDYHCMNTWLQMMIYEHYPRLVRDELALIDAGMGFSRRESGGSHSLLDVCSRRLGSALHIAAAHDRVGCLKRLLESGASPDTKCEGVGTALHSAVFGHSECAVLALLEYGADPKATDDQGNSPLHYAILMQRIEMVNRMLKSLSEAGIDLNHRIGMHGNAAQTAGRHNKWLDMKRLADIAVEVDANNSGLYRSYSHGPLPSASRLRYEAVGLIKRPGAQD